jgi:hypothetical protein
MYFKFIYPAEFLHGATSMDLDLHHEKYPREKFLDLFDNIN